MTTITRLQHAAITVPFDGLERARDFYGRILALREVPRPPELHDRPGIWYSLGATELHIQARETVTDAGDRHAALVVDDIDGWRQRLRAEDVEVVDQPALYGRQRFNIRDPFGNLLELMTEGDAVL